MGNQCLTYQLESVQRKSARWICNQWNYEASPTAMVKDLQLQTLQARRQLNRLSTLYQFNHGIKFMPPGTINKQRCTNLRFQPIQGAILCYTYSFYPLSINEWNKLPANIVNTSSLDIFKVNLLAHLK